MKQLIALCLVLGCSFAMLGANDLPEPGVLPLAKELPPGLEISPTRIAPEYSFSVNPVPVFTSYYDYMIGSLNNIPLKVLPLSEGGGYLMTYHGRRTPTGTRRVFFSHLDANGILMVNTEISAANNNEGYPTIAFDPVAAKPQYAWHMNYDADAYYEDIFVSDAFLGGISGLFGDLLIIQNAPITITPSNAAATTDNEFLWPSMVTGPSPIAGKRRVYVVMRNSVTHTYGPSENAYIRFADFNASDIENGNTLNWNTTHFSVPEMDDWNHDDEWRRPVFAITCDNAGNLYLCGYHTAMQADGTTPINESDLDVFKCGNYGEGTWTRLSRFSSLPSWNPPESPNSTVGYFRDSMGVPYADNELSWKITSSGHLNAAMDANGNIHVPALWGLTATDNSYYAPLQFVKEYVFQPNAPLINIREIHPKNHPDNANSQCYQPWDTAAPWGVVDSYGYDMDNVSHPNMTNAWNFPYWDRLAHDGAMMFHYNNIKMTDANSQGMMAVVWQSSFRARMHNEFEAPAFADYANTPEIYISVTDNNGTSWSEPIVLNSVITPQLASMKPMWVYPADKIIYTGLENGQRVGKLGLMFYNDYTWGANAITPPVHPTSDGGQVMFAELRIVFPFGNQPVDPFGDPVVMSNSMHIEAAVRIAGTNATAGDVLAAYVEVNGIVQLRGKQTVRIQNNLPYCPIEVFSETEDETVYFKIWDYGSHDTYDAPQSLFIDFDTTVGAFPDALYLINGSSNLVQNIRLQEGWNMVSLNVHPANLSINSLISQVEPRIQMIKSPQGVFVPDDSFNTLNSLADGKGCMIKVDRPMNFLVEGYAINTGTPIPLSSGWNLTGFTPQEPLPVSEALQSLIPNLLEVRGEHGSYIPGNPNNTLSHLAPGKAYWIRLSAEDTLIYPSDTSAPASRKELHHEK